jgi:phthalate 4,5-dioxygenase oxygenase subunit
MANCFMQDRKAIRRGDSTSGLPDFIFEDAAVLVSQGPIGDRTREHLVPADIGSVQLRRTLMDSARRVVEGGDPVGRGLTLDSSTICSYEYAVPNGSTWHAMIPAHASSRNLDRDAKCA